MSAPTAHDRLAYLDWLRGVTVLVMIEAHSFDAWMQPQEKTREVYGWLMILGGMAAPAFLFMAGVAVALAAGTRMRRGASAVEAARRGERRGWQIFLYAFLFRLQSFVLGGFGNAVGLLKVDILNIMGPALVATAAAWRLPGNRLTRGLTLAAGAGAIALLTPPIRNAAWPSALPDAVEWYLRPDPGKGTFTLFPWAAFVLAGAVLGLSLDGGRAWRPWRLQALVAVAGLLLVWFGWWASWQAPLFPTARFWTSSPTFFTLRVGLLVLCVHAAWLWSVRPWPRLSASSPLEVLGVGSLFVYWVHVELVYGEAGTALKRRLTLEQSVIAWFALSLLMYVLLLSWNRMAPARARIRERLLTYV